MSNRAEPDGGSWSASWSSSGGSCLTEENSERMMAKSKLIDAIKRLHAAIDAEAAPIAAANRRRLRCSLGCTDCCVDNLSVFEIEADRIRAHNEALLTQGEPAPEGRCAFLDPEGGCRIYEDRPYVCRTQGLPFRWWEEGPDGVAEFRDICARNEDDGPPLVQLKAKECWTLGPYEGRLAQLESERSGEGLRRIRLRDLFRKACPENASR